MTRNVGVWCQQVLDVFADVCNRFMLGMCRRHPKLHPSDVDLSNADADLLRNQN